MVDVLDDDDAAHPGRAHHAPQRGGGIAEVREQKPGVDEIIRGVVIELIDARSPEHDVRELLALGLFSGQR